ncbi:hypothetical protein WG904_00005 [Pedobacter sp. Du54]|uniref:WapI family immunity protein n=1 Tax=Pedobacter anseongensis TaxID=3133439 RepID=UPI00309AE1E7
MTQIGEVITLETNSVSESLFFNVDYLVEDYFTIKVSVISNGFSGASNFCFNRIDILTFVDQLSRMYDLLDGTATIRDTDSDGFLEFKANDLGRIMVSGQIGGTHNVQYIRFGFSTDQTA